MESPETRPSHIRIMEDLVDEAGIDVHVDVNWSISDFILALIKAKGGSRSLLAFSKELDLDRNFLRKVVNSAELPRAREGRKMADQDERYKKIAEHFGLNVALFQTLVMELQTIQSRPDIFSRTGIDDAVRRTRIELMRAFNVNLGDTMEIGPVADMEKEVENILEQFARRLRGV